MEAVESVPTLTETVEDEKPDGDDTPTTVTGSPQSPILQPEAEPTPDREGVEFRSNADDDDAVDDTGEADADDGEERA